MSSLKKTGLNSSIAKSEFFCGKHFNNLSKTFTLPNNKLKSYSIADYKKLNSFDKKLLRFEYKCSTMFFNKKFYKNMETIHDVVTDFMKAPLDQALGSHWGHFMFNFILVLYTIVLFPIYVRLLWGESEPGSEL